MTPQAKELVDYIQENCLWQFFSRAWDREANITGVLNQLDVLLKGEQPKLETPLDRVHFADANSLAREVKTAFPWINEKSDAERRSLIDEVIERLREITITLSKNGELQMQAY